MSKINTESYGLEKYFPNYSFELGRALGDRLQTLWNELSEEERKEHKEQIERYERSLKVIRDIDSKKPEKAENALKENMEALQYLNRVFFLKFREHLVLYPINMGLEEFPTYD